MPKIEKQLKKVVVDYKPKDETFQELESFKEATKKFNELVKSGIVAKRGNRQKLRLSFTIVSPLPQTIKSE